MRLQASPANGSTRQVLPALCLSTDSVGDAVYIRGPRVGSYFQVTRIDIDDIAVVPAFGLIVQKLDATHCLIQKQGLVNNLYTGLTPNEPLFIGLDGRLTQILPPPPTPTIGKRCIQILGYALDTAIFYLEPKSPIIRVS